MFYSFCYQTPNPNKADVFETQLREISFHNRSLEKNRAAFRI